MTKIVSQSPNQDASSELASFTLASSKSTSSETKSSAISKATLLRFEPIARLSPNRLDELAPLCIVEQVSKDLDPTRMNASTQALYLLKGDLGIRYENGQKLSLQSGDYVKIEPNVKHWVDAFEDSNFLLIK